ncbi:MAG: aminoglycoside phosphotransferase [Epsilonproteobacteria bacterium]|nr:MAG: aminoglycoside phosphotransferase [Campylobacterota bacterium]
MNKIRAWLVSVGYEKFTLEVASADASFRQYYRLKEGEKTFIVMDSSLEKSSLIPFINVTNRLLRSGLKAPVIFARNLEEGWLVLEDFGSTHYLDLLNEDNYKTLYRNAIDGILTMQTADSTNLPIYDKAFLHTEMDLMRQWFLEDYIVLALSESDKKMIEDCLNLISDVVLSQPQGLFVHRDFHSRNIMLTSHDELAVIDYQDAMSGAITYDLVSLLKDCYIAYASEDIEALALYFKDLKGLDVSDELFIKWFDFMGLQRHIKVLGIFARLYLRDGKDGYLKDLPLTLKYVVETAAKYEETKALSELLKKVVLPPRGDQKR